MPTNLVQVWVYPETRDIAKKLAKLAGISIADIFRGYVKNPVAEQEGYAHEHKNEEALAGKSILRRKKETSTSGQEEVTESYDERYERIMATKQNEQLP